MSGTAGARAIAHRSGDIACGHSRIAAGEYTLYAGFSQRVDFDESPHGPLFELTPQLLSQGRGHLAMWQSEYPRQLDHPPAA